MPALLSSALRSRGSWSMHAQHRAESRVPGTEITAFGGREVNMTVLILTTHLNRGGISRYCVNLARGLHAAGHRVVVASGGGEWAESLAQLGIAHCHIPIQTKLIVSGKVWLAYFRLVSGMKNRQIDMIHANTRVTQFLSRLLARRWRVPSVSTFHGFYRPSFIRRVLPCAGDRTIAVSQAVRRHLVADLHIPPARIRVVPNGIDLESFAGTKGKKEQFGYPTHVFLFGILGRISEEKGHFLAVKAFARLSRGNFYLVCSGRGKKEAELDHLIRSLGVSDRVRRGEWNAERFLDIIDVLLVPSRKEGFGYVVLEAFAKGVPVIASRTGGLEELIRDRENGVLVPPRDPAALAAAMGELAADAHLRRTFAERGRREAREFSVNVMTRKTEQVYYELMRKDGES
ncbi:MAG: glycosyltransferase [Candidatus Omnitrophica bacterium]|nr:glycosyltransferase [Candidatus Omnitrophota bacterium]